jgi:CRP-like cAMP-binding protein
MNPAFSAARPEVLRKLAEASQHGAWDDGRTILRAGEKQKYVYVVGDGGFELFRRPRGEKTHVLLGHIAPPRFFGDATLFGSGI